MTQGAQTSDGKRWRTFATRGDRHLRVKGDGHFVRMDGRMEGRTQRSTYRGGAHLKILVFQRKNHFEDRPYPLKKSRIWVDKRKNPKNVVIGVRNLGYCFWGAGKFFWRWICRHVRWKVSASVDGGLSGGSGVRRPGSEDPHRRLLFTFTFRFISEPYNKHK